MFFFSPRRTRSLTEFFFFFHSFSFVIQRSFATKDLVYIHVVAFLYVLEILHYTSFRSGWQVWRWGRIHTGRKLKNSVTSCWGLCPKKLCVLSCELKMYSVVNKIFICDNLCNLWWTFHRITQKKTSFYGRYHVVFFTLQRYGARNAMSRGLGDYFAIKMLRRFNMQNRWDRRYSILSTQRVISFVPCM
jgi:hypothetical protein